MFCPRCGNKLKKGGTLTSNPDRTGNKIQVYVCWRCGYRTTKD